MYAALPEIRIRTAKQWQLLGGSHYLSFLLLAIMSKVRIVRTIMSIS